MSWTYVQGSGKLYRPDGTLAGVGYAGGNGGLNQEGVNNHAMQMVKNVGPLPVGQYRRGVVLLTSNLGPYAIPLIPNAWNVMYGRTGFFVHGDRTNPPARSASHGCIILPRAVREEFYKSEDSDLIVVHIQGV